METEAGQESLGHKAKEARSHQKLEEASELPPLEPLEVAPPRWPAEA